MFLGGAFPWLEAVVVIPAGIIAGLPTVPVVIAATAGNLLTIALSAWFGEHIRSWFSRWRDRREAQKHDQETLARKETKRAKRQQRIERVMNRGGIPALALFGPIIGTQIMAVAVVAMGISAVRSFFWISLGTIGWAILAAAATRGGFQIFGLG
ncbi:small multi-drug export protein [Nesterenkonia sp. MY13]|uniref:Small multi-drug export protein n=2 Tax=Nesterenkonia sedimenti TaxID=1463632 RepID=A0A7X8TK15_9MICC|nr:small multi-drug export protein [Nesterenkonia sedimenti]